MHRAEGCYSAIDAGMTADVPNALCTLAAKPRPVDESINSGGAADEESRRQSVAAVGIDFGAAQLGRRGQE